MRMSEAEKKAAALPPKLTVPMILFFLPVLFVVILGPAGDPGLRDDGTHWTALRRTAPLIRASIHPSRQLMEPRIEPRMRRSASDGFSAAGGRFAGGFCVSAALSICRR